MGHSLWLLHTFACSPFNEQMFMEDLLCAGHQPPAKHDPIPALQGLPADRRPKRTKPTYNWAVALGVFFF